jgi:hypothetical protein
LIPCRLLEREGPLPVGQEFAMRKWIVTTTIAVLLAAASSTAGSAQTTGVIGGTVRDVQTGQVLEGSVVSVAGTALSAAVNAAGRFQITNVPVGQATVRVQRIGYAVASPLRRCSCRVSSWWATAHSGGRA